MEAGDVSHTIPSISISVSIPIPVRVPVRVPVALNAHSLREESDRIAKGGNRFTVAYGRYPGPWFVRVDGRSCQSSRVMDVAAPTDPRSSDPPMHQEQSS
jgi:hypothetical protein